MLQLVLALAVAQAEVPANPPGDEQGVTQPPAPQPDWMPKPVPPEGPPAEEPPPEVRATPPSLLNRTIFTGLGAIGGSVVGLGLSLALTGCPSRSTCTSPTMDITFANAVLSSLMLTGVAFTVNQSLGGKGEIILAFFASLAVMGGSAVAAHAIDGTMPATPILTTAIGTLPAAALSVLILELSAPRRHGRPQVQLGLLPGGGFVGLTQAF